MTKTMKKCAIFFITTVWLVIWRIVFSVVELSDNAVDWIFSSVVQVVGMGVIPLVLYKFWVKEDILSGLYIKVKLPPMVYVLAVVTGILVSYLTRGVSLIWQNMLILLGYTHINSAGTIYNNFGVFIMDLITTAFMPAIFEELTDRGVAISALKGLDDDRVVVVLVAVLFGLAHQNIVQTGYAFVGGLVFAFFAVKTKSIIPGMIMHFINNASNVIAAYSEQKGGGIAKADRAISDFISDHFLFAILSWILTAAIIVLICRYLAKITKPTEPQASEDDVYYYPNKMQYVDDLFGSGFRKELTKNPAPAWYEYAFLYGSVALSVLTTIFTFVWGVWR